MWTVKLSRGVIRIATPLGPRYLRLTFSQRLFLLWTFRHFESLPLQVLTQRERKLLDSLCAQQAFVTLPPDQYEDAVIGTVERPQQPSIELPPRKPVERVTKAAVAPMAAEFPQNRS
jgi:hypothetical protein